MVNQFRLVLAAAALTGIAAVGAAQTPQSEPAPAQQAAPVQRAYPGQYQSGPATQIGPVAIAPGQTLSPGANDETAIPAAGVLLRVGPHSAVREVSSDPQKLELSVERGVANVSVHKPAKDLLILVDLPGGQTQLLKNGLYTFDAQTNTARVLKGEALAFPATETGSTQTASNEKPMKVKEDHKVVFNGTDVKPHEFPPYEARMDLLAPPVNPDEAGGDYYYGYAPYGDGFYGSPYWAYGYYPWPYPYYGFAYPYYAYPFGVGLGIGYVGGWGHFGGFHGGGVHVGGFHGGGFHGGGFHGRR